MNLRNSSNCINEQRTDVGVFGARRPSSKRALDLPQGKQETGRKREIKIKLSGREGKKLQGNK
jgi:hypothetical protein